jgi:hypothetical protein
LISGAWLREEGSMRVTHLVLLCYKSWHYMRILRCRKRPCHEGKH